MDAVAHFAHLIEVEGREDRVEDGHANADVVVWVLLLISSVSDLALLVEEVLIGQNEHAEEAAANGQDLNACYYLVVEEVAG